MKKKIKSFSDVGIQVKFDFLLGAFYAMTSIVGTGVIIYYKGFFFLMGMWLVFIVISLITTGTAAFFHALFKSINKEAKNDEVEKE